MTISFRCLGLVIDLKKSMMSYIIMCSYTLVVDKDGGTLIKKWGRRCCACPRAEERYVLVPVRILPPLAGFTDGADRRQDVRYSKEEESK